MLRSDSGHGDAATDPATLTTWHVRKAIDGDVESTAWMIEHLAPLLLEHAAWRLGPAARWVDPRDLVQDAWVATLPRLRDLQPRDGRFTPVLLRFLSTTVLFSTQRLLRREAVRRRSAAAPTDADASGAGDAVHGIASPHSDAPARAMRSEAQDLVRTAIATLPSPDREIVLMHGIEQQRAHVVAGLLGLSKDAVSKRYQRALARLRQAMPSSVFDELSDEPHAERGDGAGARDREDDA